MNSRLCRSRTNSKIGQVCGGPAKYFNIDSVLVRLFFILLIRSGMSVLAYVIHWIILPFDPRAAARR